MTKKGKKVVSKKNRDKGPSKVSQVECFNYRGGCLLLIVPTPKRKKKVMRVT